MVVSGVILQLSAIGAQNAYINSTDYTLFKSGIRAFTNFAKGEILINPQSAGGGFYGSELQYKIPRSGDLLHKLYFTCLVSGVQKPAFGEAAFTDSLGHALIQYVQIDIGGTKFDKIYSEHLEIRSEQENMVGKDADTMIYRASELSGYLGQQDYARDTQRLFVELPFWFHKFVEQSLPVIALMFHDIEIKIGLRKKEDVIQLIPSTPSDIFTPPGVTLGAEIPSSHPQFVPRGTFPIVAPTAPSAIIGPGVVNPLVYAIATNVIDGSTIPEAQGKMYNPQLCASFIYLDQLERKLFAGSGHEYVIAQHQFLNEESKGAGVQNMNLIKNFSHPILEFNMVCRQDKYTQTPYSKQWFNFSGLPRDTRYQRKYGGGGPDKYAQSSLGLNDLILESWQLTLNNHNRLPDQNDWGMDYYRKVVPYETHQKIPRPQLDVFSYSFAIKPENLLATGTLNCSRIDNIEFRLQFASDLPSAKIMIFGRNMNVIKISSGLAGLRFSS
jgi:hypothetical protein